MTVWGGSRHGSGRKPLTPDEKRAAILAARLNSARNLLAKHEGAGTATGSSRNGGVQSPRPVSENAPAAISEARRGRKNRLSRAERRSRRLKAESTVAPDQVGKNPQEPGAPGIPRISVDDLQALLDLSARYGRKPRKAADSPFRITDMHPPSAVPPPGLRMAMDSEPQNWASNQWLLSAQFSVFAEGMLFLGYPVLAEMAQRPEFRVISETIATECTRKWIKFSTRTGADSKKKPGDADNQGSELDQKDDLDSDDGQAEGPGARETDDESDDARQGTERRGAEDDAFQNLAKKLAEMEKEPGNRDQDEDEILKTPAELGGNMRDGDEDEGEKPKDDKSGKIEELVDFLDKMQLRERCAELITQDGFFGRSHLFLDFGQGVDLGNQELATPIGSGRDELSKSKVAKGMKMSVRTVEAVWTYPMQYNANNPLAPDFYNPQFWYVMGTQIHASRLLTFVGHPVPDILKPAYSFGGLSLTQMAKPYVDIWLQTRESVAALIHSFSVMVLETDLQTLLQPGGAADLMARAALFNTMRDNQSLMMINKNTEGFQNVSSSLAGLHELQAQSQEHMAAVSRIPLVKLLGIQPAGLNASSEGEIRVFYDTIAAYQQSFLRPNLTRIIDFAMICLWGAVDDDIVFEFEELWSMTEKERSESRKADAETDATYIDGGVIHPEEVRTRLAADPDSPYQGIDPDDVPEPPEPEMPPGMGGPPGKGIPGAGAPPGAGGAKPPGARPTAPKPPPGGADDASPFSGLIDAILAASIPDDQKKSLLLALDAEWKESDHPRDADGKFGSGGGGAGGGMQKAPKGSHAAMSKPAVKQPPVSPAKSNNAVAKAGVGQSLIHPAMMKHVGPQMGSNVGGVYENDKGEQFYMKKPKTAAHVVNEKAAAALYNLAGVNTLQYVPVSGGDMVATKLEKLEKNNISQLSSIQKMDARRDFAVHAWLGNWDAAGTGGDNQGVVNGKVTTLDTGGSMKFRAQGEPKNFGKEAVEFETMRDPDVSPDAAKLYGSMEDYELAKSVEKVTDLSDDEIRYVADTMGLSKEDADVLIARKDSLAQQMGAIDPQWEADHPRGPDGRYLKKAGGEEPPMATGNPETDFETLKKYTPEFHAALENATISGGNLEMGEQIMKLATGNNATAEAAVLAMPGSVQTALLNKYGSMEKAYEAAKAAPAAAPTAKGSKKQQAAELLQKGVTTKEMLATLGWPSISMPAMAKSLGMNLEKTKVNGQWVYKGTPMTAEQKTAVKTEVKAAQAKAAEPPKPAEIAKTVAEPPKGAVPAPTPAELEKAKKSAPLQPQYVPGMNDLQLPTNKAVANGLLQAFNDKWANKQITDPAQLAEKVGHFKSMAKAIETIKADDAVKSQQAQVQKNLAAAEALKKSQSEAKAKNAEYMKALGITEVQATAFDALVEAHGTGSKDVIERFKGYEKQAKQLGYSQISGFEYALVRDYINSGYTGLNKQLRADNMSPKMHVYREILNAALDKMPKYSGMVERGTSLTPEQIEKYVPGMVKPEAAFTSTGINFKFSGNVHYKIRANGKSGADFSHGANTGEREVLFKAGTHFLVHKVENKGGKTYIEMEEV